jgi:hypothetical protein
MSVMDNRDVLVGGTPMEAREERLADGADELAGKRTTVVGGQNILLVAAGALLTAGLTAIVLGWVGAAHSTIVAEQLPYLISGGLLGVALAIVGAVTYFAHWLTILVRENRERDAARLREHAELLAELRLLRGALTREEESNGAARSPQRGRPLRRAPGGP